MEILLGPIIRDVADDYISILLGLSDSAPLSLEVLQKTSKNKDAIRVTLKVKDFRRRQISLSPRLVLVTIKAAFDRPGVTGKIKLYYQIRSTNQKLSEQLTELMNELSDDERGWIQFPAQNHDIHRVPGPSFTFAASCRKLSSSRGDAIVALRKRVKDAAKESTPYRLFLIGDQIYADEVSQDFLTIIEAVAARLFPHYKAPGSLKSRRGIIRNTEISADNQDAHLFGFEEYAAMYLIGWSPDAWPAAFNPKLRARREETIAWREVMSKTPTYCLFDDHDITDDWFINSDWKRRVLGSALGPQFIASALSAYGLFQLFGGVADPFDDDDLKSIENLLRNDIDKLWKELPRLMRMKWGYGLGYPPTVFLDTRVNRHVSSDIISAKCIDLSGKTIEVRSDFRWEFFKRQDLRDLLSHVKVDATRRLLFCAANPVFEMPVIRYALENAIRFSSVERLDAESWYNSPISWANLALEIDGAARYAEILFISGDVHYSYIAEGEFNVSGRIHRCLQIVSSPVCNEAELEVPFGGGYGNWNAEVCWYRNDGLVDILPRVEESESTLSAIKSLISAKGGRYVIRRWRIIGSITSSFRPDYANNFVSVAHGADNIEASLIDSNNRVINFTRGRP